MHHPTDRIAHTICYTRCPLRKKGRKKKKENNFKEGNVLFNNALNTFYLVIWHWKPAAAT